MPRAPLWLPPALIALACAPDPVVFGADLAVARCDLYAACYPQSALDLAYYFRRDDCRLLVEEELAATLDGCPLDGGRARACIDEWEALSCEELLGGWPSTPSCADLCAD